MANQNPEQIARDLIDEKLRDAGWAVQSKGNVDLNASRGVAIREYASDTGPMDYMLMVDGKPCGVIEAKKAEEGHRLSTVEEQSDEYSVSKLKFFGQQDLRFIYESTGEVTRLRDTHDPNFKAWTFKYNAEHPGARLTEEQMAFLRMIRDHVASSFHISTDDMEYAPFDGIGGPFRFRALFGDNAAQILEDLNLALAA